MLRPGQADHDAHAAVRRLIQQVVTRRRVGPDRVDAEVRHQAEVFGHLAERRKLIAVGAGCERAVRHTLD